jgi:predicted nucleotidyltransferase
MEGKTTIWFTILSLYRTDYNASLHVRNMAKLLGVSHVTLLPHLGQLERIGVLRSERVGRNRQFTLNKANILTEYYLTIAEELVTVDYLEKNFLMRKLAEHICETNLANPLILFGSYAEDYATEESDIDLFIIGKIPDEKINHLQRFELTFGKKINIQSATIENFNSGLRTGDILIKEVVKKHIVLHNAGLFVNLLWRYHTEK